MTESWCHVWREGVAPLLSTPSLRALQRALEDDDPRLIQRATTEPPPLHCVKDELVTGACLVGYCGVIGLGGWGGEVTVLEVEEFFTHVCLDANTRLEDDGQKMAELLTWYDETPRTEMRQGLLEEVTKVLQERGAR